MIWLTGGGNDLFKLKAFILFTSRLRSMIVGLLVNILQRIETLLEHFDLESVLSKLTHSIEREHNE
jgi:hypothetical protein